MAKLYQGSDATDDKRGMTYMSEGRRRKKELGRISDERVEQINIMRDQSKHSDVLGSYTGTSADGGKPVQDADDL